MPKSTCSSDRVLRSRSNSRESASGMCTTKSTRRKRTETVCLRGSKFPWKPKEILEPRRSTRVLEEIREALAETMSDLHFPFIKSTPVETLTSSKSEADTFASLRWSTVQNPHYHLSAWRNTRNQNHRIYKSQYAKCSGPGWDIPPSEAPDRVVIQYIAQLRTKWHGDPKLQISTCWKAFADVNWEHQSLSSKLRTTDSLDELGPEEEFMTPSQYEEPATEQEALMTAICCRPREIRYPRDRRQYDPLHLMHPIHFNGRYRTKAHAEQHCTRLTNCKEYSQRSVNQDLWPQTAISDLLLPVQPKYDPTRIPPVQATDLSEVQQTRDVGRLIANAVATEVFPCQYRVKLSWPDALSLGTQVPVVEYTCHATHMTLGRSQVHPLLFAAVHRERFQHREACKRLALAFQPMMTLFILYYLDTRTSQNEPMPEWMVLFGVVYDKRGLDIRACYPSFWLPTTQPFHQGGAYSQRYEGWGSTEFSICHEYDDILEKQAWERGSVLAILYRIQMHCQYVLDRLQCWDGYDRANELLRISYQCRLSRHE